MRPLALLALLLLLSPVDLYAAQRGQQQERPKPVEGSPASESRSYVELFTKLERDWIQAVQEKDKTALDAILAPEFMLRTSENPERPQPRADWIHLALTRYDIRSFSQRAMAIRAFLGVAVVSFMQSEHATLDGKDRSGDYLVVDLWEANHGKWQVSARYVAPIGNCDEAVPKQGQRGSTTVGCDTGFGCVEASQIGDIASSASRGSLEILTISPKSFTESGVPPWV